MSNFLKGICVLDQLMFDTFVIDTSSIRYAKCTYNSRIGFTSCLQSYVSIVYFKDDTIQASSSGEARSDLKDHKKVTFIKRMMLTKVMDFGKQRWNKNDISFF